MAVDCTGTRAIGRIPSISKDTVTAIFLKTKNWVWQVNYDYIRDNQSIDVLLVSSEQVDVNEVEMDEM